MAEYISVARPVDQNFAVAEADRRVGTSHLEDVPPMTLAEAVDDDREAKVEQLEAEHDALVEESRTANPRRQRELEARSVEIIDELVTEVWEEPDGCGLCGGPLVLLGNLGNVTVSRCRNCGADHLGET